MNIILPIVNYKKIKAKEKEAGIGESLKNIGDVGTGNKTNPGVVVKVAVWITARSSFEKEHGSVKNSTSLNPKSHKNSCVDHSTVQPGLRIKCISDVSKKARFEPNI